MGLILNIDTATEIAIISISEKDIVLDFMTNENQKDHASFLQPAIKTLLQKINLSINQLNAVSVTLGPGSYTGIRVGMASAKGLCYALNIPLITLSTLEIIALSAINKIKDESALYCSLIDARRMEVFAAVYDYHLTPVVKPCSIILDQESFIQLLDSHKIYFSGNGIEKLKPLLVNKNAYYLNEERIESMIKLSWESYQNQSFADLFYSSPDYIKEFYTYKSPQ